MVSRARVRLLDILDAIARVEKYVSGLDLEAYRLDPDKQWLIERGVEIISEASRHIPQDMLDKHPEIRWRDIRDIGNRMRHEYDRVDSGILWTIATHRLPELKPVIAAMLMTLEQPPTT
jgi:uncharacterized protein with HEPN domain